MIILLMLAKKSSKDENNNDVDMENMSENTIDTEKSSSSEQSSQYLSQARAILLEANISGANVRDAQDLFKRALNAHKNKQYDKSIDLAIECIDLVDNIMKNE